MRKKVVQVVSILFAVGFLVGQGWAVEPSEVLEDPALELRARDISKQLRCLVCQNENIDSSSAQLAKDLRVLVRERLLGGDSDQEVIAFVVARYGDFVLLKPPVQRNTVVLWLAPILLLILGTTVVIFTVRRQSDGFLTAEAEELSGEETNRLKKLLQEPDV